MCACVDVGECVHVLIECMLIGETSVTHPIPSHTPHPNRPQLTCFGFDLAIEAAVPWMNLPHFLTLNTQPEVGDDISWIVVWDESAPARPDTIRAIHQRHWQYWDVVVRFDRLPVVVEELSQWCHVKVKI